VKNRFTVLQLALAGLTGALYAVLSYFSNIFGLTFGPVQCRLSEALTVLPFLCPPAAWGLFAGCVVTNILSPYGVLDVAFGSLATLLAGSLTAKCKTKWLAPLPPVLCNAVIVGAVIAYQTAGFSNAFLPSFLYNMATVGAGELAVCYGLGLPLLSLLERTGLFTPAAAASKNL